MKRYVAWAIGLLICFGARAGQHTDPCAANLAGEITFPPGWGFSPDRVRSVVAHSPERAAEIKRLAALAAWLATAKPAFFEFLGAFDQLGVVEEEGEEGKPYDVRLATVSDVIEVAILRGEITQALEPQNIELIARALGPLPVPDKTFRPRPITTASDPAVLQWAANNPIPYHRLIAHQKSAQWALLLRTAYELNLNLDPTPVAEIWDARMRGEKRALPAEWVPVFDRVHRLLVGEYFALDQLNVPERDRGRKSGDVLIENLYVGRSLGVLFRRADTAVQQLEERAEGHKAFPSAFYYLLSFDEVMRADVSADQGLTPLIRRAYVEAVLGQKVMPGSVVRNRITEVIRQRLVELRKTGGSRPNSIEIPPPCETSCAASVLPSVLSREERLATYRPPVKERAASTELPTPGAPPLVVDRDAHSSDEFWDEITNPNLSTAEAIRLIGERLRPDHIYEMRSRPAGHVFRVSFSQKLIDQLVDPKRRGPADPRVWFTTMRRGFTTWEGQRGWRKHHPPYLGLYDWKIKIKKGIGDRMMGSFTGSHWRFDLIVDEHA